LLECVLQASISTLNEQNKVISLFSLPLNTKPPYQVGLSRSWLTAYNAERVPDVLARKRIEQALLIRCRHFGGTTAAHIETFDPGVSRQENSVVARQSLRLEDTIH
jgi:hypothetical protein